MSFLKKLLSPLKKKSSAQSNFLAAHLKEKDVFYSEDNLSTNHNHDFAIEERFLTAFKTYLDTPFQRENPGNHHGRWNIHVVLWAATHAVRLKSDIVQLGVFEGSEACAMAGYTDFASTQSTMYLVDTFEGVPEYQWSNAERLAGADSAQWAYKKEAEKMDVFNYVRNKLKHYPNINVVKGVVPDVLTSIRSNAIGCLLLDLNCALPEIAAANYLWDTVKTGGLIISDDYGHSRKGEGYIEQKIAFDNFAKSKNVEVLTLPTGHGLIIKP
jgi:hypothetical protein